MDLFTLSARLTLDKSQYDRGVEQAERQGRQLGDSLDKNIGEKGKRASKGLSKIGKAGVAALGAAAVAVGKFAVKAMGMAGELEQQIGGSEAVWGEYAQYVQKKGKEAFEVLGLSQAEYLANANKMGALLQGSGFEASEAVTMTTDAMQRAADIASIMGIDVTDAMQAINGMAKGNFTMMDNLGVKMDDATIKAYAMSKGMKKSAVKNLTQQQKIQLAFEYFMKQSEYAAGNYAKENDTLAGSLNSLKAAFANLMSGAGGADEVSRMLDKALDAILKTFDQLAPKVISSLSELLTKVAAKLPGLLQTVMPSLVSGVILLLNGLITALPAIMQALVDALPELISGLTDLIPNLLSALEAVFTVVIVNLPEILKTLLIGLADALIAIINTAFGTNLPKIENIKFPEWKDISAKFSIWWAGIKAKIRANASWLLGSFLGVSSKTSDGQTKTPSQIVGEWWEKYKKGVVSTCRWMLGYFTGVGDTAADGSPLTAGEIVGEWWSRIKGGCVSACSWLLGSFTGVSSKTADGQTKTPSQIIGEWWGKWKANATSTCRWLLGTFTGVDDTNADGSQKTAAEIVSGWWDKTKAGCIQACSWLLGIFGWVGTENGDGTAKTPAQIVSEWWGEVKAGCINACSWLLGLFSWVGSDGEETPASIVGQWWDSVKADVRGACNWLLNLFGGVSATNKDGKTVSQVINGWWPSVKTAIKGLCNFVLDLFGVPDLNEQVKAIKNWWCGEDGQGGVWKEIQGFLKTAFGIDVPDWATVSEKITKWWNDNVSKLKLFFTATFGGVNFGDWWDQGTEGVDAALSGDLPSPREGFGKIWQGLGGRATGLDFVPQNDYVVRTHFGEAILNRSDADAWRSGRNNSGVDYGAFAAALVEAMSGMAVEMDGEAVGVLVARTVDEQIGVMAHNDRYSRG